MNGITEQQQKELSEKYKKIYALYTGTDSTLQQVGDEFGLSRQRVQQIASNTKRGPGNDGLITTIGKSDIESMNTRRHPHPCQAL